MRPQEAVRDAGETQEGVAWSVPRTERQCPPDSYRDGVGGPLGGDRSQPNGTHIFCICLVYYLSPSTSMSLLTAVSLASGTVPRTYKVLSKYWLNEGRK